MLKLTGEFLQARLYCEWRVFWFWDLNQKPAGVSASGNAVHLSNLKFGTPAKLKDCLIEHAFSESTYRFCRLSSLADGAVADLDPPGSARFVVHQINLLI
jgi:hypothetical protein